MEDQNQLHTPSPINNRPTDGRTIFAVWSAIVITVCSVALIIYLFPAPEEPPADTAASAASDSMARVLETLSGDYTRLMLELRGIVRERTQSQIAANDEDGLFRGDPVEHDLLLSAKQRLAKGDYAGAEKDLQMLLRLNPPLRTQYDINMILGMNAMLAGNNGPAKTAFSRSKFLGEQIGDSGLEADANFRLTQVRELERGVKLARAEDLKRDIELRIAEMDDFATSSTHRDVMVSKQHNGDAGADISGMLAALDAIQAHGSDAKTERLVEFYRQQNLVLAALLNDMKKSPHDLKLLEARLTIPRFELEKLEAEPAQMTLGRSNGSVLEFASASKGRMDNIVSGYKRTYPGLTGGVRLRFAISETGDAHSVEVLESMWNNAEAATKVNAALGQVVEGWKFRVGEEDKGDVFRLVTLYYE